MVHPPGVSCQRHKTICFGVQALFKLTTCLVLIKRALLGGLGEAWAAGFRSCQTFQGWDFLSCAPQSFAECSEEIMQ